MNFPLYLVRLKLFMKKITFVLLSFFSVAGFAQDLSQNLLLDYRFDGNANDASANAYHADPHNVAYVPDRFGTPGAACYFNGVNSFVNFPNLAELKPQLPVSFSFWIKYDSNNYQQQVVFNTSMEENHATSVVFNSSGATSQYVINCADGSYLYSSESRRSYASNSIVDSSQWHFITIVVASETDMKIYVDCEETGGTYSGEGGPLQYSLNPGCLGRHDRSNSLPADYFLGSIDDFRYWDKALTPDDIFKVCDDEGMALAVETVADTFNPIKIFPNPAHDVLYISAEHQNLETIAIYNALGQQILSRAYGPAVDVSGLDAGIYFVKVSNAEGSQTEKVVIR